MDEMKQASRGDRQARSRTKERAAAAAAAGLPPLLEHVRTRLRRLPRQQRSRAKVAALLAAAERLFVEHGYDAVTADAIAAAAGVGTGTFYAYFGDKRDVLLVLLAEHVEQVLGVDPAPPVGGAPSEARAALRAAVASAVARGTDPRTV